MKKKFIALILSLSLVLSLFGSITVLADDEEEETYETAVLGENTVYVEGNTVYLSFTPDETSYYRIYSTGSDDTCGCLLDSSFETIEEDDDSGDTFNFWIESKLEAGTTYYIGIGFWNSSDEGEVTFYIESYDPYSGTCGDDVTWNIEDGTLYITGTGEMYDYEQYEAGPWWDLVDEISSIVIGEGITYIGTYAFWYMYNVTSVTISSTVETIAQGAFDTVSVTEIVIPESVTYIGYEAFVNCYNLESLVINAENVTVNSNAFYNCSSLKSLEINSEEIIIGERVFGNCSSLENLVINLEYVYIGMFAFADCTSLESIVIDAVNVDIDSYAFGYCTSLASVVINAQAVIYARAFFGCTSLTDVYVESGSVYDYAFYYCFSLSEISGGAETGEIVVYNFPGYYWTSFSDNILTICYSGNITDLITSITINGEELDADDYTTELNVAYTYIYIGSDIFPSGGEYTVSVEYEYDSETYSDSFSVTVEGILSAAYEDGVLTLSSDCGRSIYYGDEALDALLADIDLSEIVTLNIEGYIYYIDSGILSEFENLSEINVSEDCLYTYEYSEKYKTIDDDGVIWTILIYEEETYGLYMDDGILYYIYSYKYSESGSSSSEGYGISSGWGEGPVQLWPAESDEEECEEHSWYVSGSSAEEDDLSDVVMTLTCSVCGSKVTIDATAELTGEDEVSCTEMWYTYYLLTAEYDGVTYTYDLALPHLGSGHSYDDGTVTSEATAKDDGEITYTCTVCGDTYTETIPASGEGVFKDSDTGNWYYYVDGEIDTSYTGFAENDYGTWYVEEGVVTFEYTGLVEDEDGTLWYVSASKVSSDTKIKKLDGIWYYLIDGAVASDYTGFAENDYGTWYVEEGVITFEYTGLVEDEDGTLWYVSASKVSSDTVIKKIDGIWYYLVDGAVASDYTGFAENSSGTWYVEEGVITFEYTGLVEDEDGTTWYVYQSKVQDTKTSVLKVNDVWYYIADGAVQYDYTGLASNSSGTWYVEEGIVTLSYNGTVTIDGVTYTIINSKVS